MAWERADVPFGNARVQRAFKGQEDGSFTPAGGVKEYIAYNGKNLTGSSFQVFPLDMPGDMILDSLLLAWNANNSTTDYYSSLTIANVEYIVRLPAGHQSLLLQPNWYYPQNATLGVDITPAGASTGQYNMVLRRDVVRPGLSNFSDL